jgi:hypothetical protein
LGFFGRLFLTEDASTLNASAATAPAGVSGASGYYPVNGIASLTPNSLATIHLPDLLGDHTWMPLTADDAMAVPAVMASLNLIAGQISRQPLVSYKDGEPLPVQPTFLYRTNGAVSPQMRVLFTLHDLILTGWSLWAVTRGADGAITDASRVPPKDWRFDSHGQVIIGNDVVDALDVILFYGPVPGGLLSVGARTIRAARDLENTRSQRLRNPSAVTELHITDDSTDIGEAAEYQEQWAEARRSPNGSVAVTPNYIEVIEHGTVEVSLLTEAQNSVAVNIAQILGLPSSLIDAAVTAGSGSASLTYQNQQNQRSWWLDTGFALWASAISSRLSMDDVVPRGTYVDFDLTNLVALPQSGEPTPRED